MIKGSSYEEYKEITWFKIHGQDQGAMNHKRVGVTQEWNNLFTKLNCSFLDSRHFLSWMSGSVSMPK